jgi:hypothetical protein
MITSDDEGELEFKVGALDGRVMFDWGKQVRWIGLTPSEARGLAELLIKWAKEAKQQITGT